MTAESPARSTDPMPGRVRVFRLISLVVAGVAAILCLGGVGVAVNLYDEATAIDRGEPDVTVDNYLRVFLIERNDVRAESLECVEDAGLAPIKAFRADIQRREEAFDVNIVVSWGPLQAGPQEPGQRAFTTEISRAIAGGTESLQTWRFSLLDGPQGWRVCEARPVE